MTPNSDYFCALEVVGGLGEPVRQKQKVHFYNNNF